MKFSRIWAMPNKNTFSIKPIHEFVHRYLEKSKCSVDPFARDNRWATFTNDLNPKTAAEYHLEAEEFLALLVKKKVQADLIILDPPYSPRQVKECYDGIGRKMATEDAWGGAMKKRRRELLWQMMAPNAVVLSFGWNTNCMGKGFQIDEILLVPHGSDHNDTICVAESMLPVTMNDPMFQ